MTIINKPILTLPYNVKEWFYTKAKADKIKIAILPFLRITHTNLKEVQKIMGMVNNMALIIPFLKFYKFAGNQLMGRFAGIEELVLAMPSRVKEDLLVCVKVAEDAMGGLPIANRPCPPPLSALHLKLKLYNYLPSLKRTPFEFQHCLLSDQFYSLIPCLKSHSKGKSSSFALLW
jgi:hypothetical protein